MIKKFLLNLFFPKKCLGCGQIDTYLCPACFTRLDSRLDSAKRAARQDKIEIIPKYQKQPYLDRVISAANYKNPLVRELIKNFKYHYIKELAKPLSQLLIKSLTLCGILDFFTPQLRGKHNAVVLPIPLYKIRHRTRGFNQAELLAKEIADYFNLPLETNILKRIVPGIPQANIKDDEKRKGNIKNVFEIHPSSLTRLRGANIILVDDVSTTGATLTETARILKSAGADKIWALVVAKG